MGTIAALQNWLAVGPELVAAAADEHPFLADVCGGLAGVCPDVARSVAIYEAQINPKPPVDTE